MGWVPRTVPRENDAIAPRRLVNFRFEKRLQGLGD